MSFGCNSYQEDKKRQKKAQSLSQIKTDTRRISSGRSTYSRDKSLVVPKESIVARTELDSHADTCVVGQNFIPISYSGRVCNVSLYSDKYEPTRDVPEVDAITAFDDQETR